MWVINAIKCVVWEKPQWPTFLPCELAIFDGQYNFTLVHQDQGTVTINIHNVYIFYPSADSVSVCLAVSITDQQCYSSNSWSYASMYLNVAWAKHLGVHENLAEGHDHSETMTLLYMYRKGQVRPSHTTSWPASTVTLPYKNSLSCTSQGNHSETLLVTTGRGRTLSFGQKPQGATRLGQV